MSDETIRAGAFDKSIREKDDVRFLLNHDGVPLARTKSGTMTLEADEFGLLVDADLDPSSPIVAGLRSAMDRGDMDQMSFAFEVTRQEWSPDWSQAGGHCRARQRRSCAGSRSEKSDSTTICL